MNHKKKFVMSYSCGKDSTLALHRMIQAGYEPVSLIVMFNRNAERSYFHGADRKMLEKYAEALGLPMICAETTGEDYHLVMEAALRQAKEQGAELACFGDIDIEANRAWSAERCAHAGIEAVFPLWQNGREENVRELLAAGYQCLIKSLNSTQLPKTMLGRILDADTVEEMKRCGIDVCGENGEYHTLVTDGPVFRKPLAYTLGEILDFGDYSVIDVKFE